MAEPENPPFRVVYPERLLEQVRQWYKEAVDLGIQLEFAVTMRTIEEQLQSNPLEWGEPGYELHALELVVCNGFQDRIQVRYAVDKERRIVYVTWYRPLPGHPLAPPS